jgi:hypothetical protein
MQEKVLILRSGGDSPDVAADMPRRCGSSGRGSTGLRFVQVCFSPLFLFLYIYFS